MAIPDAGEVRKRVYWECYEQG